MTRSSWDSCAGRLGAHYSDHDVQHGAQGGALMMEGARGRDGRECGGVAPGAWRPLDPEGRDMRQLSGQDASFLYLETPRRRCTSPDSDLRPVHRARRQGHVQGHPRPHRSRLHVSPVVPPDGSCGCRSTSTTRTGSRTPTSTSSSTSATSPCRSPATGASCASRPPGSTSRPLDLEPAAVGDLRHRGSRQRRRRAARLLRPHEQDPPCRRRRRVAAGDHQRHPRPRRRIAPPTDADDALAARADARAAASC